MKVRVYPEGDDGPARVYAQDPRCAAELFAASDAHNHERRVDLIVEALDTEAVALGGWSEDGDGPPFRMFKARAVSTWDVTEVATLNPYYVGNVGAKGDA